MSEMRKNIFCLTKNTYNPQRKLGVVGVIICKNNKDQSDSCQTKSISYEKISGGCTQLAVEAIVLALNVMKEKIDANEIKCDEEQNYNISSQNNDTSIISFLGFGGNGKKPAKENIIITTKSKIVFDLTKSPDPESRKPEYKIKYENFYGIYDEMIQRGYTITITKNIYSGLTECDNQEYNHEYLNERELQLSSKVKQDYDQILKSSPLNKVVGKNVIKKNLTDSSIVRDMNSHQVNSTLISSNQVLPQNCDNSTSTSGDKTLQEIRFDEGKPIDYIEIDAQTCDFERKTIMDFTFSDGRNDNTLSLQSEIYDKSQEHYFSDASYSPDRKIGITTHSWLKKQPNRTSLVVDVLKGYDFNVHFGNSMIKYGCTELEILSVIECMEDFKSDRQKANNTVNSVCFYTDSQSVMNIFGSNINQGNLRQIIDCEKLSHNDDNENNTLMKELDFIKQYFMYSLLDILPKTYEKIYFIKLKGHSPSKEKTPIEREFSEVDKLARKKLRHCLSVLDKRERCLGGEDLSIVVKAIKMGFNCKYVDDLLQKQKTHKQQRLDEQQQQQHHEEINNCLIC